MKKSSTQLLIVMVLIVCAGVLWRNYGSVNIPISGAKFNIELKEKKTVYCDIVANIDSRNHLRAEMQIPTEDKRQYDDLKNKLPVIKSAFLTTIDQKEMRRMIKKRDFDGIKKKYLEVINGILEEPVETIYFGSFLYY